MNPGAAWDVLGLGAVAVDEVLHVESFPPPDQKRSVLCRERHCGGLAAVALIAAARMGARAAYAGVLGADEASRFAFDQLREEGIGLCHALQDPSASIIRSTVIVDASRGTRNVFFNLSGVVGADADRLDPAVVASTRVLLVDHLGIPGMLKAARLARDLGIPVVADFELSDHPLFPELVALSDHLVLSRDFACRWTGLSDPRAVVDRLREGRTVILTCGAEGGWYGSADREPHPYPAWRVETRDTTGCGDVFHGVYAAALAEGKPLEERIQWAAAAAALKATRPGGIQGIARRDEVLSLIREAATKGGS